MQHWRGLVVCIGQVVRLVLPEVEDGLRSVVVEAFLAVALAGVSDSILLDEFCK